MNRDEIILMAQKAHLVMYDYDHPSLERFAALVAAAEREACAKVCQDEINRVKPIYSVVAENAMKAIRARGQA